MGVCICGFCNVLMCVFVGFVMFEFLQCVGVLVIHVCVLVFTVFSIVCTAFFVLFRLCIFILICFVCTSVRTTATE